MDSNPSSPDAVVEGIGTPLRAAPTPSAQPDQPLYVGPLSLDSEIPDSQAAQHPTPGEADPHTDDETLVGSKEGAMTADSASPVPPPSPDAGAPTTTVAAPLPADAPISPQATPLPADAPISPQATPQAALLPRRSPCCDRAIDDLLRHGHWENSSRPPQSTLVLSSPPQESTCTGRRSTSLHAGADPRPPLPPRPLLLPRLSTGRRCRSSAHSASWASTSRSPLP